MLREDYETPFTTLNQPFEIGIPNKHSRLRLTEIDIQHLPTNQIFPYRKIIRFNSTYLETIDSWEFIRGRATVLALPMWIACLYGLLICLYILIDAFSKLDYISSLIFFAGSIFLSYMIYIYYRICKYDLLGYTHYPIRFNRKTQKVYAFSPQQQKIIELNWQDLRFSTVEEKSEIELRASKVNQDNLVEDEIIFPYRIPRYQPELAAQHVAFFKAYMESEDLSKLDESITEFYDIYDRKETWRESFERLYMQYDIEENTSSKRPKERTILFVVLGVMMWFTQLLCKRLGLLFSKIPQWPAHIERECQIEAKDPYDSTGKSRHLEPLKFTLSQMALITLTGLIEFSLLFAFLIALTVFSLNTW